MKKTIFFVVQTGFAIRNVLRSDAFRKFKDRKDVRIIIFSSLYNDGKFKKEFGAKNVYFEKLYSNQNVSRSEWFFKELKGIIQAYRRPTDSYELMIRRAKKRWPFKYYVARLLRPILRTNFVSEIVNFIDIRLFGDKRYDGLIEKYKPTFIFFSGIYDFDAHPLERRAFLKKIPCISLVTSWDNLSKGSLVTKPKKLIVWNKIMKKEAISLHDFNERDVVVVGSPPFDAYHNVKLKSRKEFFKEMGLSPKKKLIVYASIAKGVIKDESFIVGDLLNLIETGKLTHDSQILARIYVRRDINEYKRFFNDKGIIFDQPKINKKLPDLWNPDKKVMEHIANTLFHADVFVSSSTTLVIESAIFDTPIVNWMYDQYSDSDYMNSIVRYFDYTHYKNIIKTKGVRLAKSPKELGDMINLYLGNSSLDRSGRKRIVEEQVGKIDGGAGLRLFDVLNSELREVS
jgi:hypothetical protein